MKAFQRALYFFAAGTGVVAPAYGFFTSFGPPWLSGAGGPITTALSAFIFYWVWSDGRHPRSLVKIRRRAVAGLVLSLLLLSAYLALLPFLTTVDPQKGNRYQIGFSTFDWSLTPAGLQDKAAKSAGPAADWMMAEGAFSNEAATMIWKPWTVATAGFFLIALYLGCFCSWTAAFGLLARHKASVDGSDHPSAASPQPPAADHPFWPQN